MHLRPPNSLVPNDEEDVSALPIFPQDRMKFYVTSNAHQMLLGSSTSTHAAVEYEPGAKRGSHNILLPLSLILSGLLLPSAVLLALVTCYKVDAGKSLFKIFERVPDMQKVNINFSATILTNISSISSTLAPFLIALLMKIWSPFIARALLRASQENSETSQSLPTPVQFSLLANMRAGRCDQLWKYGLQRWQASRTGPLVLRQTTIVLFMSLFVTFLTFLGDQFFHIWTESENLYQYTVPGTLSSFGRGLTPECISFNRSNNYGLPCTRDGFLSNQEYAERENQVSLILANTSQLNQINFLTATDLPRGDLTVLYPASGVAPPNVDYRATTLGVSTQCQFMTPMCKIKHISEILTQFNCSESFFGVLGKPANISYDLLSKAQDPDVPGLAWKISPSLEYMFYSDPNLQVPYNVLGLDPETGNGDPNLPLLPNSKLVNPVYLAVAGRVSISDISLESTLATQSSSDLFVPTDNDGVFDFFLNCSYTTYDVEYTMFNGTTQPDFTFTPTPNGSVAEEWHGIQQYVSLDGDPSNGLAQSSILAAQQKTPEDYARAWANLYSVRVLAAIGAYTNPRANIQEQNRDQLLVTSIVPWTLGFLLAANFIYALLGLVVSAIAWAVSTTEVLEVSEKMDLNKQIAGRYGGLEMGRFGKDTDRVTSTEVVSEEASDSGIRVGVIGDKFEALYLAA